MIVVYETDRSGLVSPTFTYGPKAKGAKVDIVDGKLVGTWHGCKIVQVRDGDPKTAAAYAITCSDVEQAKACLRAFNGSAWDRNDWEGQYGPLGQEECPEWALKVLAA